MPGGTTRQYTMTMETALPLAAFKITSSILRFAARWAIFKYEFCGLLIKRCRSWRSTICGSSQSSMDTRRRECGVSTIDVSA